MARTPKPPKLSHGGIFTPAHQAIWNGALGIWCPFVGIPLVIGQFAWYITEGTPEHETVQNFIYFLFEATGWLIGGAIVLSILFSPAFWVLIAYLFRTVRGWFKPSENSGLEEDYSHDIVLLFWAQLKRSINIHLLWIMAIPVLPYIAVATAYDSFTGAPFMQTMTEYATPVFRPLIGYWLVFLAAYHLGLAGLRTHAIWHEEELQYSANPRAETVNAKNKPTQKQNQKADFNADPFAFDPSAFNEQKQRKTARRSKKPKAKTDRHPDDADLWEVVNDAGSTAEERKTALDMILEREAARSRDTKTP